MFARVAERNEGKKIGGMKKWHEYCLKLKSEKYDTGLK